MSIELSSSTTSYFEHAGARSSAWSSDAGMTAYLDRDGTPTSHLVQSPISVIPGYLLLQRFDGVWSSIGFCRSAWLNFLILSIVDKNYGGATLSNLLEDLMSFLRHSLI